MKKIVAITSCPVGIAHTYMAAENLEKAGEELGVSVKVETHGSIGVENDLTAQEIKEAIGVIIAADTNIDKSRFDGKMVVTVGVQDGIHHPKDLVNKILTTQSMVNVSTIQKNIKHMTKIILPKKAISFVSWKLVHCQLQSASVL